MGPLVNGKVMDCAFSHDLHLHTLQTAMQVMSEEWAQQNHHQQVQQQVRGEDLIEVYASREEEAETTAGPNPV